MEALAASRNDSLLILDAMGQVDGKEVGVIAYMLANGQPKLRMSDNITLRKLPSWRLLFLSTGETNLADHMAAALELAGEWGLTGWPEDEGTAAVKTCFADWLRQRGGAGSHEHEEAAILA